MPVRVKRARDSRSRLTRLGRRAYPRRMTTATKPWTIEEPHRLPDDGNKYELVRGELFVTPPPSVDHEEVLARLAKILMAFVEKHGLGNVYHPRSVVRFEGSEVEPDLMVRQPMKS